MTIPSYAREAERQPAALWVRQCPTAAQYPAAADGYFLQKRAIRVCAAASSADVPRV